MAYETQSPEIQKIRDRLISDQWHKFILSVSIKGLHGLDEKTVSFKFPICAIVGENGTGKSTLLKVAACAYRSSEISSTLFPSDFFPDTAWEKLEDVVLKYQLRQGPKIITHDIKKPTERWRGITERIENKVYYFDLNRLQPIESVIGYSKLAKKAITETSSKDLQIDSVDNISEIIGRPYTSSRYAKTSADNKKEVGILGFKFGELSEFHQGAGEATISRFIKTIENIPDHTLVIIDEVESSLHPKAQRRLIRQLLKLTRVKRLQVILSTHSPYVLSELPRDARILLARTTDGIEIVYGPSVELCLSEIDDKLYSELDIMVEDNESKVIVTELVRNYAPEIHQKIRIIPVGPYNVVDTLDRLDKEEKIPYNLLGIIDGDQDAKSAIKLPGKFAPEKQVIQDVSSKSVDKLAQVLILNRSLVEKEIIEVQTVIDYHEWLARLGDRFNVSPIILWNNLVSVWVKDCLPRDEALKLTDAIKDRLSRHRTAR